jgi:hypothetical protein
MVPRARPRNSVSLDIPKRPAVNKKPTGKRASQQILTPTIIMAPSEILTPEEMSAFHARQWQQEVGREQAEIRLKSPDRHSGEIICSSGHKNLAGSFFCDECGAPVKQTF